MIKKSDKIEEMDFENEIKKISNEYWREVEKLKKKQKEIINEYISKLEEKKKEELMKSFS